MFINGNVHAVVSLMLCRHCEERSNPESIPILKIIGMKNKSFCTKNAKNNRVNIKWIVYLFQSLDGKSSLSVKKR